MTEHEKLPAYSLSSVVEDSPRGAFAIFCDDIRQEVSGKQTFVGVYDTKMFLQEFPALIPQFWIHAAAWTNHGRPFGKAIFRILLDDDILQEIPSDIEQVHRAYVEQRSAAGIEDTTDPTVRMSVKIRARLSPFFVPKAGILRVRVETEDGELRAGGLSIEGLSVPSEGVEAVAEE